MPGQRHTCSLGRRVSTPLDPGSGRQVSTALDLGSGRAWPKTHVQVQKVGVHPTGTWIQKAGIHHAGPWVREGSVHPQCVHEVSPTLPVPLAQQDTELPRPRGPGIRGSGDANQPQGCSIMRTRGPQHRLRGFRGPWNLSPWDTRLLLLPCSLYAGGSDSRTLTTP